MTEDHRFSIAKKDALPLFDAGVSLPCWAYNEELSIEDFLHRADAMMRSSVEDYEIVLIDDCSTDRFYPTRMAQGFKVESLSSFINPELLLRAYWQGAEMVEVPISFISRSAGEAKGTRMIGNCYESNDVMAFPENG